MIPPSYARATSLPVSPTSFFPRAKEQQEHLELELTLLKQASDVCVPPPQHTSIPLQISIKTVASPLVTSALAQILGRQGVQWWGDPVSDGSSTTFLNDWLRIVDATTSLQRHAQLSMLRMIPVWWAAVVNGGGWLNFQDFQDFQDTGHGRHVRNLLALDGISGAENTGIGSLTYLQVAAVSGGVLSEQSEQSDASWNGNR